MPNFDRKRYFNISATLFIFSIKICADNFRNSLLLSSILPSANYPDEAFLMKPREMSLDIGYLSNGTSVFLETAKLFLPLTDKISTHRYQIMYGKNLLPYYYNNPKMKMLEIGLGCDMNYGPGASVKLWKALFPQAELWEAEFDAACVESNRETSLKGFNVLVGDQGDPEVLDKWIEESGGDFDVVIDDGGHKNCQIWTTFQKLWPTVKPGGLYFIEDMQVAGLPQFMNSTSTCDGTDFLFPDKLKEMMEKLIYRYGKKYETSRRGRKKLDAERKEMNVESLFCQSEACVLQKGL